jgi:hypothetical protein
LQEEHGHERTSIVKNVGAKQRELACEKIDS